ncbi:hypothetical protein FPSE_09987 [Fusarium pseudograminearum CS3096]|uniref:Heterokaryon incompatibility domain-containing protein n=1 Tax=Fusarium pseudograminearum (strain CS3096) TaxID=1028729 RepID=K3VY09_FUSPC|nr:hypothetical protein FPSE_09987 [Fusarium pseudograminearum CS3096]EKJ69830.1 hypothetical protein FPSE_09987 [Fusarium pseudograminearum CS3096]
MTFSFLPPAGAECQRCAQLGIQNVSNVELSTESSNLVAQRLVFDAPIPPCLPSCPSCRRLCRYYYNTAGSIQPSRIFGEDLAVADADSLLRNSLWTCMQGSQEVSQFRRTPGFPLQPLDTFGKAFPDSTEGTVRIVQKKPNYAAISAWLRYCHDRHLPCQSEYSPPLKNIFLIDVYEKTLVSYPGDSTKPVEYLALSYVWGSGANYRVSGPGPIAIERLSQTVQDSIAVTKNLKMRYLWVDAVCIDQDDRQKKHEQMDYMASIYRGAWATIVAVDSNSRNSGMSRVHPESQRSHQLRIEFGNGNILIQKFPSFDQQLAVSPWMGRGWTYQEALLSQRLVLFTKHQVYYSCNSMNCCEALNDEQAFGDNIKPISHHAGNKDDRPPKTDLHFPTRNELRRNKLLEYERLLNLYLRRHLSYDKDILNAFAGLLQRLQQLAFPTGFWNGLPKESFMQCLLWRQERHDYDSYGCPRCCTNPALATRRKCLPFPTWSWTGWHLKSGVHFPHCVAEFEQEERDKIRDKVDLRPPLIIETANGQALFDNLRDTHRMWQPRKRHRHHLKPLLARLSTTRAHTAIESSCHSPDPPNPYRKGFSAPKTSDSIDNCTFDPEMEKDTKLKVRGIVLELPCRTSNQA